MRQSIVILAIVSLGCLPLPAWAQKAVIVVRHADKAPGEGNVPLSPDGQSRARKLAVVLKDAGVGAIYVSPLLRTQQTAKPLADALQLPSVQLTADQLKQKLQRLAVDHPNQVVLFVGHTDTVPAIVDKVSAQNNGIVIQDTEYDWLFALYPRADGSWALIRGRY